MGRIVVTQRIDILSGITTAISAAILTNTNPVITIIEKIVNVKRCIVLVLIKYNNLFFKEAVA